MTDYNPAHQWNSTCSGGD